MKKIETLPVIILCNVVLRYCVFIKIKYIIRKVNFIFLIPFVAICNRLFDIVIHSLRYLKPANGLAANKENSVTPSRDKRVTQVHTWQSGAASLFIARRLATRQRDSTPSSQRGAASLFIAHRLAHSSKTDQIKIA